MYETARYRVRLIFIYYVFKDAVICLDTVVGIVTDYGSIPMIFLLQNVWSGSDAHPTSCSVSTAGSFVGVKPPGREANHLVPMLRMGGPLPQPPRMNSWHSQGQLYICILRTPSGPS
jgi:hypothetical protein